MKKVWYTPGGEASGICLDMLKRPHLLIAGATGSGKSVLINSLIYTALYKAPGDVNFVLIDPKRVELHKYKALPHTMRYACEIDDILQALIDSLMLMENRYRRMQRAGLEQSEDGHVYIMIDEYADLIIQAKKRVEPFIIRLAQLGRAANVHLIVATQRPTRDIITGAVKVNIDTRVALRCPSPQDSRNIIDQKGAEDLPQYGYGFYRRSEGMDIVQIPMTPKPDILARVRWWTDQTGLRSLFFRPA